METIALMANVIDKLELSVEHSIEVAWNRGKVRLRNGREKIGPVGARFKMGTCFADMGFYGGEIWALIATRFIKREHRERVYCRAGFAGCEDIVSHADNRT